MGSKLGTLAKRCPMFTGLSRLSSHVNPLVENKRVLAVELFQTTFTVHIWPLSSVHLPVPNKVWPLGKGFPTTAALVRLLSRVNFLVLTEFRDAAEGFPTLAALIVTAMNSPVHVEVGALAKGLPTLAALVRPLSSVDSLVLGKCVFSGEHFPTFAAPVTLCQVVRAPPSSMLLGGVILL